MADKNIILKISQIGADKAQKGLRKVDKGLKALGRAAVATTAAYIGARGMINAFRQSIDAAEKQFMAEAKLASALKNVTTASEGGSQALIQYAKDLQKVTTFGDENIISGMAMLATFQLNETQIKELTPRLLDMAAATNEAALKGGDLAPVALQLGKAFTGQVSALTRSGVVIDQNALAMARAKGSTEEFNFVLGELDKNFAGIAQSIAQSAVGKLIQMRNAIGDNKEMIGTQMIPVQEMFTSALQKTTKFLSEQIVANKAHRDTEGSWIDKKNAARKAVEEMNSAMKVEIDQLKVLEQQQLKNQKFMEEQGLLMLQQQIDLLQGGLTLEEELLLVRNELSMNQQLSTEGIISENEMKKRNLVLTGQQIRLEQQLVNAKLQGTSNMLGAMASLAAATQSDKLFVARLQQAAALIDMYAGASAMLPNIPASLAVIAQGTANLIMIEKGMSQMASAAVGADFITSGPQMLMVGDNPTGKERVQVTPIGSPNINGPQSGISVNINGPITNDDYVRDFIIPEIQKATRLDLA